MLDRKIKITLSQLIPKLGDKSHNLHLIKNAMQKAKNQDSNMIVFPELFLTGYSIGDKIEEIAEPINGPSIEKVKKLSKQNELYTVVGFPEVNKSNSYYISSALIGPDGNLLGTYRKTHLFDKEKQYFQSGKEFKVIPTPIGNIGLMICFDVEFPETARALKLMGADLIVVVNANMHPYKKHHYTYAKARAMENEIPLVICNRLGKEGELHFCGDSLVFNSWGKELLYLNDTESVKSVELPLTSVMDTKMNYISRRRKELYSILTK